MEGQLDGVFKRMRESARHNWLVSANRLECFSFHRNLNINLGVRSYNYYEYDRYFISTIFKNWTSQLGLTDISIRAEAVRVVVVRVVRVVQRWCH